MGSFTSKQWFDIISGVNAGLITGAALLQTLFGQDITLKIVAVLGILGIIINSVSGAVNGQANLVKQVAAMPGVEKITVNATANTTLASVATDAAQPKVGATDPGTRQVLQETIAKGA